jgi:hypothetical protein
MHIVPLCYHGYLSSLFSLVNRIRKYTFIEFPDQCKPVLVASLPSLYSLYNRRRSHVDGATPSLLAISAQVYSPPTLNNSNTSFSSSPALRRFCMFAPFPSCSRILPKHNANIYVRVCDKCHVFFMTFVTCAKVNQGVIVVVPLENKDG